MKLFFEPSGDGMPACIHDETGAIVCECKYDDFKADVAMPERIMKRMIELLNKDVDMII